jgi:hypothetical protein
MVEKDCVLYALHRRDIPVIKSNEIYFDVDVDKFKYLYIGITNNYRHRMTQHRNSINKVKYGGKLIPRIKSHGWGAYEKTILLSGLTRDEAKKAEVDTISLYRTFELGLNSTPGGDGCGIGASHHKAQAVNVFNNKTGEITSFLWIGEAAKFLGILDVCVGSTANPNQPEKTQTFSPIFDSWFQIKHVDDNEPFEYDMKSQYEKTTEKNRKCVVLVNLDTRVETEFDGVDVAASSLSISQFNIHTTINRFNKQFNVGNDRYDAQYVPKSRDWNFDIMPTNKAKSLAQQKALVAYDKNNEIAYEFESALKAEEYTGIKGSNISQSVNHRTLYAGNLRWEFKDSIKRAEIEKKRPRKVT